MANVEYFYNKCNEVLNTHYTSADWGEDITYRPINLEWLSMTIPQVFKKIHNPKTRTTSTNFGCNLYLSTRFNYTSSKLAVPIEVVNSVVSYLANFNRPCDNDCACYRNLNCQCDCTAACASFCSGPATCSGRTVSPQQCECTCSNCNCNCTCPNCACECGSNSECVCDCDPYDCNCNQLMNCNHGSASPKPSNCVYHCGKCVCNCECDCSSSSGGNSNDGGNEDDGTHNEPICNHHACQQCCPPPREGYRLASIGYSGYWLNGCYYSPNLACVHNARESYGVTISNCPSAWWCCGKAF